MQQNFLINNLFSLKKLLICFLQKHGIHHKVLFSKFEVTILPKFITQKLFDDVCKV
jgi:hypothetical protein